MGESPMATGSSYPPSDDTQERDRDGKKLERGDPVPPDGLEAAPGGLAGDDCWRGKEDVNSYPVFSENSWLINSAQSLTEKAPSICNIELPWASSFRRKGRLSTNVST